MTNVQKPHVGPPRVFVHPLVAAAEQRLLNSKKTEGAMPSISLEDRVAALERVVMAMHLKMREKGLI